MISIRCLLGIHRYGPWTWAGVQRELAPGVWQQAGRCACVRCGIVASDWSTPERRMDR